ncbi:unnamed protein product [Brachionus calyciflorus]|uniref:Uncharacterized protein n=1 Tax=Brachionus calyciflorus TaxID=104777 RepID=A0A814GM26_9BILA|nr:unnamed protein product [Brachionus calyciflorus]
MFKQIFFFPSTKENFLRKIDHLAVVIDGTYTRFKESANNKFQYSCWSGQKKDLLIKPFVISGGCDLVVGSGLANDSGLAGGFGLVVGSGLATAGSGLSLASAGLDSGSVFANGFGLATVGSDNDGRLVSGCNLSSGSGFTCAFDLATVFNSSSDEFVFLKSSGVFKGRSTVFSKKLLFLI